MAGVEALRNPGWVARPEQRNGRGERGEDVEHQTRFDIFHTFRPRPSSTQGVPPKPGLPFGPAPATLSEQSMPTDSGDDGRRDERTVEDGRFVR